MTKNNYHFFSILLFVGLFSTLTFAQQIFNRDKEDDQQNKTQFEFPSNNSMQGLMPNMVASVTEETYIVDAGDVFLVKVDVPGPALRIYPVTITADGYAPLPDTKSVFIKRKSLKEAKQAIYQALSRKNPGAIVEVFLYQLHPINVTILGAFENDIRLSLMSNSHLFDAVESAATMDKQQKLAELQNQEPLPVRNDIEVAPASIEEKAYRRVKLRRDGQEYVYDLLRFKILGDATQNPYLMERDVIIVPYKGERSHTVLVEGAVGRAFEFEHKQGDRLIDAVAFAGGLLETADSANIDLYSFEVNKTQTRNQKLDYKAAKDMLLQADDRIFVRFKANYHPKYKVELRGEVRFPGQYVIEDGETTLKQIIEKAGGLSGTAALKSSRIIRRKYRLEDRELSRLRRMTVEEMNDIERNYFRLRSRENLSVVVTDFEKLFLAENQQEDVVLRDEDLIIIPSAQKLVFVSGGIFFPGNVAFDPSLATLDYIRLAGGYNTRAQRGNVKIIKSKTGSWQDVDKTTSIEEGDIIFVPEKIDRDWWAVFKEGLIITSQLATILFIISNASK